MNVIFHAKRATAFDAYFTLAPLSGAALVTAWTPEAGQVKAIRDGAAAANTTNLPTHIGSGVWKLTLTASEMDAGVIVVVMSSPLVFLDTALMVQTSLMGEVLQVDGRYREQVARRKDPTRGR